jgi:branched-chain amino acid transport system ATP-binding protein
VNPILEAKSLTKRFGGIAANNDVNFGIEDGEIHAVIGPNGAGKSTFISQLSGEQRPDSGKVLFEGNDITRLPIDRRARLGIGRCYQITRVLHDQTVLDNVSTAVLAKRGAHLDMWRDARKDRSLLDPAARLIDAVGLAGREFVVAQALSHGERRQLELAMALAMKPKVLLLDEPMAGMGPAESVVVIRLIASLSPRVAIVLVEHDMDAVFALATRISVLVDGHVIATGTPDAIVADSAVQDAYLSVADRARSHA